MVWHWTWGTSHFFFSAWVFSGFISFARRFSRGKFNFLKDGQGNALTVVESLCEWKEGSERLL
jgi:hypothetical protein